MLLEDAGSLTEALRQHLALKAAGQQGAIYRTRAAQLTPLAAGLSRANADYEALRAAGLPLGAPEPKPGLRAHAQDLLQRFKADHAVLAEADETFRFQFVPGVRKATEDLDTQVQEAWTAHVTARDDFPTEDVLTALGAIPSYATQVQRVREAANEFHRLAETPPAAASVAGALAGLEAARRKKDDALAAMKGDDLPADVLAFLRKTAQGGAGLSDLSDGVLAWLTARGLASAFRIVPTRA